jgi:hypothetical protein
MLHDACQVDACRFDSTYKYLNIQRNIQTHLNFVEYRMDEAATMAFRTIVEHGGDSAAQQQISRWLVLQQHYRALLGREPLPDDYYIRLEVGYDSVGDETI